MNKPSKFILLSLSFLMLTLISCSSPQQIAPNPCLTYSTVYPKETSCLTPEEKRKIANNNYAWETKCAKSTGVR